MNPGLTLRSAWKLRIIRPELTSSTSASAICIGTNVCCDRWRSRVRLAPRPPATRRGREPRPGVLEDRNEPEQQP